MERRRLDYLGNVKCLKSLSKLSLEERIDVIFVLSYHPITVCINIEDIEEYKENRKKSFAQPM